VNALTYNVSYGLFFKILTVIGYVLLQERSLDTDNFIYLWKRV
jgi:hypothetical protein